MSILDLAKFKNELLARRYLIIDACFKCTGINKKYHEKDFEYVLNFLENFERMSKDFIKKNLSEKLMHFPKGNLLLIASANEPIIMNIIPLIYALWGGNSVFLKPSSKNKPAVEILDPICQKLFKNQYELAKFSPNNLENFLCSKTINSIFCFGSFKTCKAVAAIANNLDIEYQFESEGNDLMVIDSTADINLASKIILNSISHHNGRSCNSIKGIFADEKIIFKLWEKLVIETKKQKYFKDKNNFELTLNLDNEEGVISKKEPGNEELLFENCNWGPNIWIAGIKIIDNSIVKLVNENPYGLGITLMSSDDNFIKFFIAKVNFPRININRDPLVVNINEPWGGIRISGRNGAVSWFRKFVNFKYVNS